MVKCRKNKYETMHFSLRIKARSGGSIHLTDTFIRHSLGPGRVLITQRLKKKVLLFNKFTCSQYWQIEEER